MGVPPAQCAVVEDSRYGVEAARAAGMRAFGYAGGLAPKGALAGPQAEVVVPRWLFPRSPFPPAPVREAGWCGSGMR